MEKQTWIQKHHVKFMPLNDIFGTSQINLKLVSCIAATWSRLGNCHPRSWCRICSPAFLLKKSRNCKGGTHPSFSFPYSKLEVSMCSIFVGSIDFLVRELLIPGITSIFAPVATFGWSIRNVNQLKTTNFPHINPYFKITYIGWVLHDKWPSDSLENSQCKLEELHWKQ